MAIPEFPGLTLGIQGHLAELELARPDTLNAFDNELHHSLTAALRYLGSHEGVRCVLLTAQGRVFSAGGSFDVIEDMAQHPQQLPQLAEDARELFSALSELPIPLVVAMHGDAAGLGATIVTLADVIVSHPAARLSDPHVRVGLAAGDGGVVSWSLALGTARARRHLLTGDPLDGQLAFELGLVTDLVAEPAAVRDAARRIAQRIAALPPLAVRGTKQAFNALTKSMGRAAFELSLEREIDCFRSEDIREALAAARAKRQGIYCGK